LAVCHNSRIQSALPGCQWLYCGVHDGRRDSIFFRIDRGKAGKGWEKIHGSTYGNPLYWDIKERDKLREQYEGQHSHSYMTQVLGQVGTVAISEFPRDAIATHVGPFSLSRVQGADMPDVAGDSVARMRLATRMRFPRVDYDMYLIGMDYGSRQDPTEMVLFGGKADKDGIVRDWYQFARVEVLGADTVQQGYFVEYVTEILNPSKVGVVCIDVQGEGRGVGDQLKRITPNPQWWIEHFVSFDAGTNIEVMDKIMSDVDDPSNWKIRKYQRKEFFTRQFQGAMVSAISNAEYDFRMWIAEEDEDAIQELMGTSSVKTRDGKGPVKFLGPVSSSNSKQFVDHITDAYRCAAAAAYEMKNLTESDGGSDVMVTSGTLFPKRLGQFAIQSA